MILLYEWPNVAPFMLSLYLWQNKLVVNLLLDIDGLMQKRHNSSANALE